MASEREKQEFNFAVSDLNRINIQCSIVEEAMLDLNTFDWWVGLQTLSGTLSPYMKDNEIAEIDKALNNVWSQIANINKRQVQLGKREIPPHVFKSLKQIYITLRKIQKARQIF